MRARRHLLIGVHSSLKTYVIYLPTGAAVFVFFVFFSFFFISFVRFKRQCEHCRIHKSNEQSRRTNNQLDVRDVTGVDATLVP